MSFMVNWKYRWTGFVYVWVMIFLGIILAFLSCVLLGILYRLGNFGFNLLQF